MEWSITLLMMNQSLEQSIPCHKLHSTRDQTQIVHRTVNLVFLRPYKNFTLTQKEKTLTELIRDRWLSYTSSGNTGLGIRSVPDLRIWLRGNDIPSCVVCNEACIKASACPNEGCNIRIHEYCLKKHRIFVSPKPSFLGQQDSLLQNQNLASSTASSNLASPKRKSNHPHEQYQLPCLCI